MMLNIITIADIVFREVHRLPTGIACRHMKEEWQQLGN